MKYPYSGLLTDFSEAPFPEATPQLDVYADQDAFGPEGLLSRRPRPITVASDGSFEVQLVASADTTPGVTYTLRCRWYTAETGGRRVLAGQSNWTFTAVVGGGPIKDMTTAPASVWIVGPPWPPKLVPGAFYLDRFTNDVGRA